MQEITGTIKLDYRWSLGEGFATFFEGLKNCRIMGSRCPKCRRILVPARKYCPRCYTDTSETVEVSDRGVVTAFTVVYYSYPGELRPPPYAIAFVRLDGADTDFVHYLEGVDITDPEEVKAKEDKIIGLRVKAAWAEKRTGTILDLRGFEPVAAPW